jgi:CheY-like chemotaxis protein
MVVEHPQRRVTVVGDSPELLDLFGDALRFEGVALALFDGTATLQAIEESVPDLLVIDLRLGAGSLTGLEVVRLVRSHRQLRRVPIIVCSAAFDEIRQHEGELTGMPALFVLPLPFSLDDLESCVREALGDRVEASLRMPPLSADHFAEVRGPTLH